MTHVGCVCAPHHRGRDIPRRAGDIPEPVGDAPRHRPGMSPLVGGTSPTRPGISPSGRGYPRRGPGMSPAAGDIPVGGSGIYYSQGYPQVFLGTFPPGRGYPRAVRRRPRLLAALKGGLARWLWRLLVERMFAHVSGAQSPNASIKTRVNCNASLRSFISQDRLRKFVCQCVSVSMLEIFSSVCVSHLWRGHPRDWQQGVGQRIGT